MSVVDEQDFFRQSVRSLPEALEGLPGVLVQKTANGHGSPFLRGFTGYRTLTLIDGVRYNNSVYRDGPNEYFSLIDVNSLAQVNVVMGPSSARYGSDAIGGTLALETKPPQYLWASEGSHYIESSQTFRYDSAEDSYWSRSEVDFGFGQQWGLRLGYSARDFGDVDAAELGSQKHTAYDESALDLRFDTQLGEQWLATIVHQNLKQDDVWRTHSTVFAEPFAGTTVGSDLRRLKDQRRRLDYIKLANPDFSGSGDLSFVDSLTVTLSHQYWQERGERLTSSMEGITESFDSRMLGLAIELESRGDWADISYGLDYYRDEVDSYRRDWLPDGSLDQLRIQGPVGDDSRFKIFGAYILSELFINERLSLTLGSRFTQTWAQVGRFEDPATGLAASFSDDWSRLTSTLQGNYYLNEKATVMLWGSVAQSFRAPNIADVSRFGKSRSSETEVAATDLSPEDFLTYEIGIKHQSDIVDLNAAYYYTKINDYITSTPTGRIIDGLTEVSKQNSASGYVQGVELSGDYTLGHGLTLFANITWLEGRLDTPGGGLDNRQQTEALSRIMPLTTKAGISWTSLDQRSWLNFSVSIVGKADKLSPADEFDTERIPPGGTPSYTVLDLRAGHQFGDKLEVSAGFDNLSDEAYRNHGSGSNEPGLSFNASIKWYLSKRY